MGAPGFDDSPIEHPHQLINPPRSITFVYPYYENPKFLKTQLLKWVSEYSWELRGRIHVIVVDDGSPDNPAEPVIKDTLSVYPMRLRLFRIGVDVRWNWLAARNIGMHHTQTEWNVLTDMDHVIPSRVANSLTTRDHRTDTIYRFGRKEHTGHIIHSHPNSMFMTKSMFWKVGGYDEALSGHYGTDGDWRRRCAETARIRLLEDRLVRYEYQGDSSTTRYKRKQPEDAGKKAIIAKRGPGWRPKTLSFPYFEVLLS